MNNLNLYTVTLEEYGTFDLFCFQCYAGSAEQAIEQAINEYHEDYVLWVNEGENVC